MKKINLLSFSFYLTMASNSICSENSKASLRKHIIRMPSSECLKENLDKAGFSDFAKKTHIHLVLGGKQLQLGDIFDEISINLIACTLSKGMLSKKYELCKILLQNYSIENLKLLI